MKVLLLFLIGLILFSSSFGQENPAKKTSPDESTIPKSLVQNRNIKNYLDGGVVSCGNFGPPYKCDFTELRSFIWNSWSKKKRSYFRWGFCGIDYCYTEYNFIEPNKKNDWRIVRYGQHSSERKFDKLHVPDSISIR